MQSSEPQSRNRAHDNSVPPLFDEDGFIIDHSLWNEQLAPAIAAQEGIAELTETHWRVIDHIRGKFLRLGALPTMRLVCRETALSRVQLHNLFGGCRSIWRIAGLPNPGEEAKAYLI
jgi:tRNA 2-thiouridine synthesizing protein E